MFALRDSEERAWQRTLESSGPITPLIHGGGAQKFPQVANTAMRKRGLNALAPTCGVQVRPAVNSAMPTGRSLWHGTKRPSAEGQGREFSAPQWLMYLRIVATLTISVRACGLSLKRRQHSTGYYSQKGLRTYVGWFHGVIAGLQTFGPEPRQKINAGRKSASKNYLEFQLQCASFPQNRYLGQSI